MTCVTINDYLDYELTEKIEQLTNFFSLIKLDESITSLVKALLKKSTIMHRKQKTTSLPYYVDPSPSDRSTLGRGPVACSVRINDRRVKAKQQNKSHQAKKVVF